MTDTTTITTKAFAIRCEQDGLAQWFKNLSDNCYMTTACDGDVPGGEYLYANRADAERDVELFRAKNTHDVEQTKRCRKNKILPATFTVLEVVKG